ncbi:hypothetical protein [Paludisphaera rhizosphaerae]|uniref:hypothetical protein n=1 Tax=Paludisphaera rhizosphaerae TaxID=2711216 RepID=UPI0013EA1298|nr:hypothetical protein [Paludisphaera rhizosphaerae]
MRLENRRFAPGVESLEGKQLLSAGLRMSRSTATTSSVDASAFSGESTLEALQGFVAAYPSISGGPRYNPVYDLNHNGQIGQDDGRILLRLLPPVGPRIPLNVQLKIAPEDQARGALPQNSGGVTISRQPTVIGRTQPGALIFSGTGTTDLKLRGPAAVADENGYFEFTPTMTDGINQFDIQVVDRYGRQVLRAFPIFWTNFAQYEAAHPRMT